MTDSELQTAETVTLNWRNRGNVMGVMPDGRRFYLPPTLIADAIIDSVLKSQNIPFTLSFDAQYGSTAVMSMQVLNIIRNRIKAELQKPARTPRQAATKRCSVCGTTNHSGAMFTTGSDSVCDDCF